MTAKKSVKRSIEVKLNGKHFSLHLEHAGFEIKPNRITTMEEEILQETLPMDYKEFMVAYNGGTLLNIGTEEVNVPKPQVVYFSNIKEMDDFELVQGMLDGVVISEKNSLALIGSNHDGSVKTFMQLKGKRKGEIYHYDFTNPEVFQKPSYKNFTEFLNTLAKTEYGIQTNKAISKPSSPRADVDFEKSLNKLPNSTKFPALQTITANLFDQVETTENEYGRILIKNKQERHNVILILTYIRDTIHEKSENDIQYYLDYFTPFRHYTISESDLEELLKDNLIDENDEITKKGVEEVEKILTEETNKLAPKTSIRPESFKRYVNVVLGDRKTALQLTQIGSSINEARVKKFEKELGSPLPKDYREFLLGYNGGYSKQSCLIIDGGVETTAIKIYRDIQTLEERLVGGPASIEWIAIGTDRDEHLVYINLKGEKRGCIYRYKYDADSEEDSSKKRSGSFNDAPKQLLANSFLEYVLNVINARDEIKDDYIDEEYLDLILSDDIKNKYPQLSGVMYTIYDSAEKDIELTGRVSVENKQDMQNIILLVKFLTTSNSEAFSTVLNHTPFKFIYINETHIEDLKKNKYLDKNGKLSRKGKDEVEKLLTETKVKEFPIESAVKKGKERKKPKTPLPKPAEKKENLKRKLEETDITTRHSTRSATKEKEGLAAKKR